MNCNRSSNNKFFNSPSLMSDGRAFTDYRPNYEINSHMIDNLNILNMHDYRMFLERNADKIMEENNKYIFMKNGRKNCKKPYEIGTMHPEHTRVVCNQHNCKRVVVNENGIGQGREYSPNEPNKILDAMKKPEYELDDNLCATLEDNFNYYPFNNNVYNPNEIRPALPSGGQILSGGDPSLIQ